MYKDIELCIREISPNKLPVKLLYNYVTSIDTIVCIEIRIDWTIRDLIRTSATNFIHETFSDDKILRAPHNAHSRF